MYCLAWLLPDGCIRLHEHKPNQVWDGKMFHRGMTLNQFRGTVTFDTMAFARAALTDEVEHFIMSWDAQGQCDGFHFDPESLAAGIPSRLDRWKGCYGKLPIKMLQEQRVSSSHRAVVPA